jgi:hypothetical protein
MKTLLYLLIIIGSLSFVGCASTTLFTTNPSGAAVYIKGEEKGTTPYRYSDTKIAFSSTPVTFREDGYKDLNIILKRTEKPAVGAIIGGMICYVPFLWFAEYDKEHSYILERIDTLDWDMSLISDLNGDSVLNRDTAIYRQDNLLIADTLPPVKAKEVTDNAAISQVTPGKDFTRRTISQFGTGLGICMKGPLIGFNYTFIGSKSWGGSIRYNANIFKSRDVPVDYYEDGYRIFSPKNYVHILSFNLLRGFTNSKRDRRFGIEAGPSWVSYNKAVLELNPNYDPDHEYESDSWFWNLFDIGWKYKYNKRHALNSTIGASLMAKMEFLLAPYAGMELALFTNINSLKTVTGFCIFFNFGDVRD